MAKIAFIGLGHMGAPMAANLMKAGHSLCVFDLSTSAIQKLETQGAIAATSAKAVAETAEIIITMLPAGAHVEQTFLGDTGVVQAVTPETLLIDCSTIDVETSRRIHDHVRSRGFDMVDAPVSGGVGGAEAATLTFMVGGTEKAYARAHPILSSMGKTIVHAGGPGNGQAAKICNNMVLGISMIAVCEAFTLAEKLGLEGQKLFDIASKSSGQCWSLTTYCPIPGPVPTAPSNRNYAPGFAASMMLKDLKLAQEASRGVSANTPLGAEAAALYQLFDSHGYGDLDFSGIIKFLRGSREV